MRALLFALPFLLGIGAIAGAAYVIRTWWRARILRTNPRILEGKTQLERQAIAELIRVQKQRERDATALVAAEQALALLLADGRDTALSIDHKALVYGALGDVRAAIKLQIGPAK